MAIVFSIFLKFIIAYTHLALERLINVWPVSFILCVYSLVSDGSKILFHPVLSHRVLGASSFICISCPSKNSRN